mgnify:CR=1 FL=1
MVGGGYGFRDPLLTWEQFETLYKVNVSIAAEINRLVLPSMVEQKKGFVVHVGSVASQEATASVGYNTVKASLAAYVRSLGREMAHTGVIITGILPGAFYAPGNSWRRLEENKPAVFDRNANGWVTIPSKIKLPNNQQDRDMIARELLVKFQMSPNHPLVDLKKAYLKF